MDKVFRICCNHRSRLEVEKGRLFLCFVLVLLDQLDGKGKLVMQ